MEGFRPSCVVVAPKGIATGIVLRRRGAAAEDGAPAGLLRNPEPEIPISLDHGAVFDGLIAPALAQVGLAALRLDPQRAETDGRAAEPSADWAELVAHAPVVLFDLSLADPAALYLLGARHAARASATLVLHAEGSAAPAPAALAARFVYPTEPGPDGVRRPRAHDIGETAAKLAAFFAERLTAARRGAVDSPFHAAEPSPSAGLRPLPDGRRAQWPIAGAERMSIGYVAGALEHAVGFDAIVNPESVYFEMARSVDASISAEIRRLSRPGGALGPAAADPVADDLAGQARRIPLPAPLHTVIDTAAGALERSHGAKRVFHIAVEHRGPEGRPQPTTDLNTGVRCLLRAINAHNSALGVRLRVSAAPIRSVLTPFFVPPRDARAARVAASQLVEGALGGLGEIAALHRRAALAQVTFLARDAVEEAALRTVLEHLQGRGVLAAPMEFGRPLALSAPDAT